MSRLPGLTSSQIDPMGLLDALPHTVIAANADGRILYANRSVETLLGWKPEELAGQAVTVLTPPRLRGAHLDGFTRYTQTGETRIMGIPTFVHAIARDGSEVPVELTLSTLGHFGDDDVVIATVRDMRGTPQPTPDGAELERQLDFTAAMTQSVGDGLYALDRAGRVTYMNRAAEEMLGWTEGELLGRNMHEAIHFQRADGTPVPEDACPLLDVMHSGNIYRAEDDVFTRKDGTILDVSYTSAPIMSQGEVVGTVLAFRDVSERKRVAWERDRAREDAEVERVRLRSLLTKAPALIATLRGSAHTIEFVNRRFREIVGERDYIGQPVRGAIPELDDALYELFDQVYASGVAHGATEQPLSFRRYGDEDQEPGYFTYVLQPTLTPQGRVDGVFLHAVDVTDQVVARQQTERLAAVQRAVLGQIAEGIIVADGTGTITYVNPAGTEILGVSELGTPLEHHSEVYHTYRPDGTLFTPEDLPLSRALLRRETILNAPVIVHRTDGRRIIMEASATPLTLDDGEQIGAVATFRDVTAQHELDRQKDEFLSTAAHDLRTPLTTIKGLAQLLQRRIARGQNVAPNQMRENIDRIADTSARMAEMIDDLLDISRIQMGRSLDLRRRPMDMVAFLYRVTQDLTHAAGRRRLRLEPALPSLVGDWDEDRLERVFDNLLSNAIKYSPDGSTVRIVIDEETEGSDRRAVVRVMDQGVGIPADDISHIFERFHRGGNVAATVPGSGIGLAGARQIVQQHGGSIDVESVEGTGSTFTVRLPLPQT